MRETTKSLISFSWAMSLFGINGITALLIPQGRGQAGTGRVQFSCEPVAQAAVNQLDPTLQGIFRTGDNFQRGVVNTVFGFINPGNWNFAQGRSAAAPGDTVPQSENGVTPPVSAKST